MAQGRTELPGLRERRERLLAELNEVAAWVAKEMQCDWATAIAVSLYLLERETNPLTGAPFHGL